MENKEEKGGEGKKTGGRRTAAGLLRRLLQGPGQSGKDALPDLMRKVQVLVFYLTD